MKTSSFYHTMTDRGRISIARYAPRWWPKGFKIYHDLAPGSWFKSVSWPDYTRLYSAQLARLDPIQVWMDLHTLAAGAEPVLCCWEDLSDPQQQCHRKLVADWLSMSLNVEIEELTEQQRNLF